VKPRSLAFCGMFGAAALALPLFFHLLRLGSLFMPMYLPLVTLAFFVPPRAAAATALLVPLLSGAVTGMPPFYPPVAPVMALELALMAALIGGLRGRFPRLPNLVTLAAALATGRLANATLFCGAAAVMRLPAGFVAGVSLLSGWPGIALMLAVVPQIARAAGQRQDRGQGSGVRVQGSGFRVQGSGFRGQGSGVRVKPRLWHGTANWSKP